MKYLFFYAKEGEMGGACATHVETFVKDVSKQV
jgi:hypothetical protein